MTSPNVVVVLTDQLRARSLGCYGNERIETPAIDGLAGDGVVFENAFSNNPICTPARGCIQTGCHSHAHGAIRNWVPLGSERPTLGECFRDAGYHTGYVGKWHLDGETGHGATIDFETADSGFVPPARRRGYEFWRGFNCGHDHHAGHPRFRRDGEPYRLREDDYQPTVQTDIAREFVECNREDPFLLFLSWGPPHPPFEAPDGYAERADAGGELPPNVPKAMAETVRASRREYDGMIASLDDEIDRLLGTLHDCDLAEDTIVAFTSDHGEMLGAHGVLPGKGGPYDEATHVPLIVGSPGGRGAVEVGRHDDAMIGLVDLMPTLLSVCGVSIPDRIQGHDLSAHLHGEGTASPDSVYLQGRLAGNGWRAIRTHEYLFTVNRRLQPLELFDLAEDPYQRYDLLGERPDLAADLLERLLAHAEACDDHQITSHAFRRGTDWGPDIDLPAE